MNERTNEQMNQHIQLTIMFGRGWVGLHTYPMLTRIWPNWNEIAFTNTTLCPDYGHLFAIGCASIIWISGLLLTLYMIVQSSYMYCEETITHEWPAIKRTLFLYLHKCKLLGRGKVDSACRANTSHISLQNGWPCACKTPVNRCREKRIFFFLHLLATRSYYIIDIRWVWNYWKRINFHRYISTTVPAEIRCLYWFCDFVHLWLCHFTVICHHGDKDGSH